MPNVKIQERLSPVNERYVAQQQTFRQGPGIRPEAQITSSVAAPADATRNQLMDLAQGLSKLTGALGDFFQSESNFGLINQKVNELRGEAGAPQSTGMGILKWGVKEGYQRGQGVKKGSELAAEFLTIGEQNKWFVDPENPDEASSNEQITKLYKELEQKHLGDSQNPEVLNGALPMVSKARLTADVEVTKLLGDAYFNANLNNFSDALSNTLKADFLPFFDNNLKYSSGIVSPEDNSRLRDSFHTNVKTLAKQFNVPIAVANGAAMDSILEGLTSELATALDPEDSREFDATAAFKKAANIYKILSTSDTSGFNFGKSYKDSKGALRNPYKQQLGNFKSLMGSLRSIADKQIKAKAERDTNLVMNSAIIDAYEGKPSDAIIQKVKDLGLTGDIKPEALEARLNGLSNIIREGKGIVTDPRVLAKFQLDMAAGKYRSYEQVDAAAREAMRLGQIHPNDIHSVISGYNSYESVSRARESHAREQKNSAAAELRLNKAAEREAKKDKEESGKSLLKRTLLENKSLLPSAVYDTLEARGLAILESGNFDPADEAAFRTKLYSTITKGDLDVLITVPAGSGQQAMKDKAEAALQWNTYRKRLTTEIKDLSSKPKTPENVAKIKKLAEQIRDIHNINTTKFNTEE